jgi:thioredoxin-dependent peroxiredoxin
MIEPMGRPAVGQPAPEFEGTTHDGDTIHLSDYRGRKLALYFYPKDDTPGCTKQACSLRDGYRELLDAGIAVVGVSADDRESHARFTERYELPFPLIADPDRRILMQYGVWGERTLYGRKMIGTLRTTFLIDEQGILREIIKRPKTEAHAEEILSRWPRPEGKSG